MYCPLASRIPDTDSENATLVANNFWGKDDAGVTPMLERMHAAKQTCDELRSFYNGEACLIAGDNIICIG